MGINATINAQQQGQFIHDVCYVYIGESSNIYALMYVASIQILFQMSLFIFYSLRISYIYNEFWSNQPPKSSSIFSKSYPTIILSHPHMLFYNNPLSPLGAASMCGDAGLSIVTWVSSYGIIPEDSQLSLSYKSSIVNGSF